MVFFLNRHKWIGKKKHSKYIIHTHTRGGNQALGLPAWLFFMGFIQCPMENRTRSPDANLAFLWIKSPIFPVLNPQRRRVKPKTLCSLPPKTLETDNGDGDKPSRAANPSRNNAGDCWCFTWGISHNTQFFILCETQFFFFTLLFFSSFLSFVFLLKGC